MKRYETQAGLFHSDLGYAATSEIFIEKNRQVLRSGLLDKYGNELFSVDEIGPIGFIDFSSNSKNS